MVSISNLLDCFIHTHYQCGCYYTGLTSVHAQDADDAYISYRYGWNLTNYNILSWNKICYRMTEDFTDPLWIYMSADLSMPGRKDWVYPFGIRERGLRTWIAL